MDQNEAIKESLKICSTWKIDPEGNNVKDCPNCPYRDPMDPFGMNCGETLMKDAMVLIDNLERLIKKQEETIRRCGKDAWDEVRKYKRKEGMLE